MLGESSGLTAVRPDERDVSPLSALRPLCDIELDAGLVGTCCGAVSMASMGRVLCDMGGRRDTTGER